MKPYFKDDFSKEWNPIPGEVSYQKLNTQGNNYELRFSHTFGASDKYFEERNFIDKK
jgi:hypothetical protein